MDFFRKTLNIATYIPWALYAFALALTFYWTAVDGNFLQNYVYSVVVFNGGVQGLWSACGHLILPKRTAKSIGWEISNFQTEVGGINLAIGITGVLCYYFYTWAIPIALILSIFYFVCIYAHLKDRFIHNNKAPCNSGPMLYNTILVSISLLFAVIALEFSGQLTDNSSLMNLF